jgi:phytoene dehydrogenase-like protein
MTVETVPGFKFHPAATGEFYVDPVMESELELTRYGLERIPAVPKLTSIFPDGDHLSMYNELEPTVEEIARFSKADADAYRAFFAKWGKMAEMFGLGTRNPPVSFAQFTAAMSASPEMEDMLRDMLFASIKEVLDRTFEHPRVKAAFLPFSEGLYSGPATCQFFLAAGRVAQPWGFVKGGLASVARATQAAAEHFGTTIRTNAEVTKILVRNGKAVGVRLADGTEVAATTVVTQLEPAKTFFDLVGRELLPGDFVRKVDEIIYECGGVTLNLALSELPDFGVPEESFGGFVGHYPSYEFGEKAYYEYTVGEIPEKLAAIGYVPSHFDRDSNFAPAGQHVLTQYVYPVPYELKQGSWETRKQELIDRWIDSLADYDPHIRQKVVGADGYTPLELEQKFGMTHGDLSHGTVRWHTMLSWRPMPGWSHYRSPIGSLYMGGVGTHAPSGVGGINGRNVANAVLEDLKKKH